MSVVQMSKVTQVSQEYRCPNNGFGLELLGAKIVLPSERFTCPCGSRHIAHSDCQMETLIHLSSGKRQAIANPNTSVEKAALLAQVGQ